MLTQVEKCCMKAEGMFVCIYVQARQEQPINCLPGVSGTSCDKQ